MSTGQIFFVVGIVGMLATAVAECYLCPHPEQTGEKNEERNLERV